MLYHNVTYTWNGVIANTSASQTGANVLRAMLDAAPGVVAHGLFPPALVATVLIARGDEVEMREIT